MIIDIVFVALMVLALIKGYSRGFIIAVFSIIALIVGLAAAIKLSALAAGYLNNSVNMSAKWLPVISFFLVFVIAVLLVRLGATALEKTFELAMLGWLNRIAGILLYAVLYTLILSVVIFYTQKIHLLSAQTLAESKTYGFLEPWGPRAMEGLGSVLPFLKGMFHELEAFFQRVADHKK
jgi:membrane protein required for colicin V production